MFESIFAIVVSSERRPIRIARQQGLIIQVRIPGRASDLYRGVGTASTCTGANLRVIHHDQQFGHVATDRAHTRDAR